MGGMFDFGLAGYRPCWLRGHNQLASHHGPRLQALAGRALTRTWVVWEASADERFADCPVVLDFDGERLEVNHGHTDQVSLTWNTIDLARPPIWPGGDEFELRWRDDVPAGLVEQRGEPVRAVSLLEWVGGDVAHGSIAVGIRLPAGWVTVFNARDENGISVGPLDPAYRPRAAGILRRSRSATRSRPTEPAHRPASPSTCVTSPSGAWMWNRRPSSPT